MARKKRRGKRDDDMAMVAAVVVNSVSRVQLYRRVPRGKHHI